MHAGVQGRMPTSSIAQMRYRETKVTLEYQSFITLLNPVSCHFFITEPYICSVQIYNDFICTRMVDCN